MALIFISYYRESRDKVDSLAEDLKALGHQVWLDSALTGGQVWWNRILAEILKCDILAFAIDRHSLDSEACLRELKYAVDLKRTILPVLMADDVSTEQLPEELAKIQFVDYCHDEREATRNLVRAVGSLPKSEERPNPLPTPPSAPISYLVGLRERIMSPETLSFEQQSARLVELRKALRESNNAEDVVEMVKHFRSRDDLLASIGREIDDLLAGIPPTPPPLPIEDESRPATLRGKCLAISKRIFGSNVSRGEDRSTEVLSLKQIWISLVGGLLVSGILDRLTFGSEITVVGWLILQPTWSLPGALLLFSSVIWKMLYFRTTYLRIGLILVPLLIGYTVLTFPLTPDISQYSGNDWVSQFAGAVIALFIVIIVFWTDTPAKKISLKSAAISLGGGLAGLVVLCLYGGRDYLASVMLARLLASVFGVYILFIFSRMVITKLKGGTPRR